MYADDQILNYLTQHPQAKDTVQGIMSWWLLGKEVGPTVVEVKAGLDKLVARGLVLAESGPDGRVYYSRSDTKLNYQEQIGIKKKGHGG